MKEKICHLKETVVITLQLPAVDLKTLRLQFTRTQVFPSRRDISSQIGHDLFLSDASGAVSALSLKSCKSYHVARSATAAESLAFAAAFDAAFALWHHLQLLPQQSVPLLMLTDLKSLFDLLTSRKTTIEGWLMSDLFVARQAYRRKEVDNFGPI